MLGTPETLVLNVETAPETLVMNVETDQQRRGRLLPRITSLFQFLRDPEPEIEGIVNEMDKAGSFASPTIPKANVSDSNWKIMPFQIGND